MIQQSKRKKWRSYLPLGKELVVDGVLIVSTWAIFGAEEFAQLGAGGYGLAKLEVDGVWHDDGFLLHHFGQAQQIPNGDLMKVFEFAGAMAHQPGYDGSGVLLVLNVEVEQRGRDAASTRRV